MKRAHLIMIAVVVIGIAASHSAAQKPAPAYKIGAIKIVPFNEQTGTFENEIAAKGDERSFFNELNISLMATVEIDGEKGSFQAGRKVEITALEGKKVKLSKTVQIGLIGDNGKYFVPVWLYSSMCSEVKFTARIIGQRTVSSMKRSVPFLCGE